MEYKSPLRKLVRFFETCAELAEVKAGIIGNKNTNKPGKRSSP